MSRKGPRSRRAPALAALAAAVLLAGCETIGESIGDSIDSVSANAPRETRMAPDRWTLSIGMLGDDGDLKLLYRAAVLAKGADYSHFQVVDYTSGNPTIQVIGTNDATAPLHCLARPDFVAHCATWDTDDILATRGQLLGKSPEMVAFDVGVAKRAEAARVR